MNSSAQTGFDGAQPRLRQWARRGWLLAAAVLYLALGAAQLGLPGLHYDEAKEAGVNAMELLTGAPVTAFRDAALSVGTLRLPLMVQDYIGALNVYLALPLLAASGIGVPNLRALSLLLGLVALFLLERAVSEWSRAGQAEPRRTPISTGGLVAVTLAAASPSFVFWSRQGIFVTNLIIPLVLLCIWQGLRWKRLGDDSALVVSALAAGLALYAKLLALWIVLPFALLMFVWWLRDSRRPRLSVVGWLAAAAAFFLPLLPLIAFNVQTGGTATALFGNLSRSYYGVNNLDFAANLAVRLPQLRQVLEGSQFWYLGGVAGNPAAFWLALILLLAGLVAAWRMPAPPLLLVLLAVAMSLFTVSDLFITHYALLYVVLVGSIACSAGALVQRMRGQRGGRLVQGALALAVLLWLVLDVRATLAYHRALAQSGGLADHSDASYDLAYHLRYGGLGSPIALDWGMEAPVRFLSEGTVTPIEIFGYESPAAPDAGFAQRLALFLPNRDNVYLLRAPGGEVFGGRRAHFLAAALQTGGTPRLEAQFAQRDGTPLYEIWRVE